MVSGCPFWSLAVCSRWNLQVIFYFCPHTAKSTLFCLPAGVGNTIELRTSLNWSSDTWMNAAFIRVGRFCFRLIENYVVVDQEYQVLQRQWLTMPRTFSEIDWAFVNSRSCLYQRKSTSGTFCTIFNWQSCKMMCFGLWLPTALTSGDNPTDLEHCVSGSDGNRGI